jgi:antitoxin (DNA-binding transcriptional repressor) of toxin-antitoxin stability system
MTHRVEVREFQEHLSEYMEKVEAGDTIIVQRDARTIATIVPAQPECRQAGRFQDVPRPNIRRLDVDPAEIVIADRERERNA